MPRTFLSTKTYGHDLGLSVCFRQWRAQSHCCFMHGYALAVRLEFAAQTLDDHGWVVDFGDLKQVKAWLVENYDHKTLVAVDDPEMQWFEQSHAKGLIDLRVLQNIGCEAFATEIFDYVTKWLESRGYAQRCRLHRVTVSEHAGNSASIEN